MTLPRLATAPAVLWLLSTVAACATATLTCDADDRQVTFSLQGNIGRDDAAAVQVTSASITLKKTRERAEIASSPETFQLVQQWAFEKELRIGIQATAPNDVSLYLAIVAQRTKSGDEGDRYAGRYLLKVRDAKGTSEIKGRIKDCEAG
jgi:hypothetical protein